MATFAVVQEAEIVILKSNVSQIVYEPCEMMLLATNYDLLVLMVFALWRSVNEMKSHPKNSSSSYETFCPNSLLVLYRGMYLLDVLARQLCGVVDFVR